MNEVHAPYHFVPLSKWVYMPDWAHLVSHDVPFKDGYSGVIEYTLTNTTPLCVGGNKNKQGVLQFARDPDKNPIIPGSSLKGMIRNVLEIASFGKFSSIDKQKFSYRDISSKSDYLLNVIGKNSVVAGWIKYNSQSGNWEFRESQYAKVAHSVILEATKKKIENEQSAADKYKKLPLTKTYLADISEPKGKQKNRWAENLTQGTTSGNFIFTNNRIKDKGETKDYEFSYFFFNPSKSISFNNIQEQVHNLFTNHNEEQVNYLKYNNNPDLGIPVFALIKNKGTRKIHSLGFAKMPRVSYKNDTHDLIKHLNPAHMCDSYFDMAELMFGTLRDDGLGLKSRVTFSDANPEKNCDWDDIIYLAKPTVLSSPKATFLGGYIEQDKVDNYNSYNNENSKLSGWKRYPSRKEYINHEPSNDNQQVQNKFELLPSGYKFNGKIVFHNLKKEELSCLIWCLTLENSPYNKHSLGHAKPLGAGSVQIKIDEKNSKIKQNIDGTYIDCSTQQWVDQFIGHMNDRFEPSGKWRTSAQIEYLMAITDDDIENSNDFSYLELDNFRTIKNQKASLPSLELNGKQLSRADIASETSASLAFCKGRLETLFDENSTFQQQQKLESEHYAERRKKQAEKAKLANEKQELKNSDLPPFERIQKQIELMVKNQDALSATEKKNKTKELREITKEIKELELTPEQAGILTQLFEGITFCPKDTNKAIKYLEKLL